MKEIVIFTILTGLAFFLFASTFVLGLIKKKKVLLIGSLIILFTSISLGSWTVYRFFNKASKKVANTFKSRTGDEIYDALFDKRKTNCVKVIHHQDQVVPKIDYAIWLHFETCPEELQRILSRHEFVGGKLAVGDWDAKIPYGETLDWFNPASLGDTIIVYEYSTTDSRSIQTIWASLDSTEVFCRDILD